MKSSFYGILTVLLAFSSMSLAAPEPAIVQGPDQWTLKTTFTHPQQIVLRRAEDNKLVRYWYIILTLTNNSKDDVYFYPECQLVTDNFQIIPAGKGIGSIVFERIKQRHKNTYPFLELLGMTDNKILQGEDNTKDIAVIWPDFDHKAKNIQIFISGLSNEIAVVNYPVKVDPEGDPSSSTGALLEYKGKSWIMR